MPITEVHAGRSYPATAPYQVTRVKIAEFARALGDDNPVYSGPDAVAPPTFAAVLAADAWGLLFDDPELGLQLRRTVHYDQGFTYARPLRAGDEVTTTLTIEKVRLRGAVAFVTVSAAVATTDGEPVCTSRSTLLHTAEEAA